MLRYIALNLVFIALAAAICWRFRHAVERRTDLKVLAVVLVLTAVFDSLLIAIGIFAYRPEYILGLYVGKAPVEDFAYAVVAALAMPVLWRTFRRKREQ